MALYLEVCRIWFIVYNFVFKLQRSLIRGCDLYLILYPDERVG